VDVRVLTQRELNRATLARQHLLARTILPPHALIEHLVGMQAQWPQAPYVGCWTRLKSFRPADLEKLLIRGEVLKATVMRQTLHLVTRRDYGLIRAAMSESNFPWETAYAKRLAPSLRKLTEAGPVTTADALAHLAGHDLGGHQPGRAWRWARSAAHIVHHHETALWRSRPEGRFVAADIPESVDPTDARAEMLRRYLAAFGPSTRADITRWSMMNAPGITRSLGRLELRRFTDERGKELLDVPDGLLPDPETPAPVRYLPKWDNVLLGFADRTRILPEEFRKIVIGLNGDVAQTFLVDGMVAGRWSVAKGKIVLEPFGKLGAATRKELKAEAERLEAFLAA
jgi:DNA glycosylase AlkZ-like